MKNIVTFLFCLIVCTAFADENSGKRSDLNIELLNMFVLRNDTDFDRTDPFYSKYGQQMGIVGTFFKPMLHLYANDSIRFYWESEIGLDIWSRNNPDVGLDEQNSSYAIGLKQREIYGELSYEGFLLKAGFQRIMDISTLFINHWIGGLKIGYKTDEYGVFLLGGEFPDQTYKGWDFTETNFMNDVYFIGVDGFYNVVDELRLNVGVYFVDDLHIIDRRRQITALEGGVGYSIEDFEIYSSAIYLHGYRQKGGADINNTNISAYAFMINSSYKYENTLKAEAVFSYMSADDEYEGNDSGAFLFGSRRYGPSLILSENDMRPIGDNIDKKMGAFDGVFYEMKAGLIGLDIGIYYIRDWLKIGPVSGILLTSNSKNSFDSHFVGWENNLIAEAVLFDSMFSFQLIGGVLIPGRAGAALLNTINREDYTNSQGEKVSVTEPVYYIQSGITFRY